MNKIYEPFLWLYIDIYLEQNIDNHKKKILNIHVFAEVNLDKWWISCKK